MAAAREVAGAVGGDVPRVPAAAAEVTAAGAEGVAEAARSSLECLHPTPPSPRPPQVFPPQRVRLAGSTNRAIQEGG